MKFKNKGKLIECESFRHPVDLARSLQLETPAAGSGERVNRVPIGGQNEREANGFGGRESSVTLARETNKRHYTWRELARSGFSGIEGKFGR